MQYKEVFEFLTVLGFFTLVTSNAKMAQSNDVTLMEKMPMTSARQVRVRRELPTTEERQMYLDVHNDFRRQQGASNMNEVVSFILFIGL